MVFRFYKKIFWLTSIRNLFRVKVNELLNGRHSAVRINVGSVAVKKSFGVIGIPCAVNGILHGTFHTGITLLILVTKNLGNVCGRSINCYHNGIGQIFVTNNLWILSFQSSGEAVRENQQQIPENKNLHICR